MNFRDIPYFMSNMTGLCWLLIINGSDTTVGNKNDLDRYRIMQLCLIDIAINTEKWRDLGLSRA